VIAFPRGLRDSHLLIACRASAATVLKEGDAAPDFVLKDADGKDVRLSSLAGKPIVLYFYPRDGSPSCTLQAKGFRDRHEELAGHGAAVIGVSLDPVEEHAEFRDKHELPFTLLADPEGRVHDLYEAWRTTLLGRNSLAVRRCTFLIDGDGIIAKVYPRPNVLRHAKQVIRDLERIQAQKAWGKPKVPTGRK
jgi:thioredoxin-dependent peroxiredoxin